MGGFISEPVLQLAALVGAITTITGAAVAFHHKVVRPVLALVADMRKTHATVERILLQIGPNGGASLRDSVDRIEHAIALAERRQRAMLQDQPHGVLEFDEEGAVLWVNRTYLRWSGRTMEESVGTGWVNAVHAGDRNRVVEEWRAAVAEARDSASEHRILRPDGDAVPVRVQTYAIRAEGLIMGWLSLVHLKDDRRAPAPPPALLAATLQ